MVIIVEAANIIDSEELEDVVHAGYKLPVWRLAKGIGVGRELEELLIIEVLARVVLAGQIAPNTLDGYIFTPLQLLDERNAVEQLAVHIPGY